MSVILIALAAAAAQSPAVTPAATPAPKSSDADRVICQKVEEVGSRLGGKKVCMTKLQWELQRKAFREGIEAQQTGRH